MSLSSFFSSILFWVLILHGTEESECPSALSDEPHSHGAGSELEEVEDATATDNQWVMVGDIRPPHVGLFKRRPYSLVSHSNVYHKGRK